MVPGLNLVTIAPSQAGAGALSAAVAAHQERVESRTSVAASFRAGTLARAAQLPPVVSPDTSAAPATLALKAAAAFRVSAWLREVSVWDWEAARATQERAEPAVGRG